MGTSAADSEPNNCSNSEFEKEETVMASSSNNQGKSFELDSLYFAAVGGDIKMFEKRSEPLDQILTPNGNTILHIHIIARRRRRSGNMDFVTGILGMCPDLLWMANKKGENLLHMAARHGHFDVAKYLLQQCKKTRYPNRDHDQELGITPTRKMLKTKSHDANDTALHEAIRNNDYKVVELLTEADSKLTYEANTAGETPLYLAAERGYAEVLKKILTTCSSPGDHGPYDRTALHVAVIRKDEVMVERLLEAGERIHKSKQDQHGWTPLHFAAHIGNIKILNKLLGVDKSAAYKTDNKGKTALHVAAGRGREDIMRKLIYECPGCCELVDKRGWNVLHFALESRNKKAVQLILRTPWLENLINEKDENGNTPFLKAVSMGSKGSIGSISNIFTMIHPKLDKQVFNHHNHNAADIMLANSNHTWFFEMMPDLFLQLFEKLLGNQADRLGLRMIVSKNEIIGEGKDEGNTVKSKSKEGEVEDEGNRMSSKSNDGKGKNESIINFLEESRRNEMLAATLIATVTFAAGFTVPGGFVADKGPDQGAAILTGNTAFRAFVILNTMSFILSSLAVFNHIYLGSASTQQRDKLTLLKQTLLVQGLLFYAMAAMIGAFISATCAVLRNDRSLAISACVVPVAMFLFLRINNFLAGRFLFKKYVKNY